MSSRMRSSRHASADLPGERLWTAAPGGCLGTRKRCSQVRLDSTSRNNRDVRRFSALRGNAWLQEGCRRARLSAGRWVCLCSHRSSPPRATLIQEGAGVSVTLAERHDPLMDMLKRIKREFICPFWKSQAAEGHSAVPRSVSVTRFPVGKLVGIKRNRPQEKVRHVPVSCLESVLRRHGGRRRCRCGPGSRRVDPSDNAHRAHSRRDRGRQRETGSHCFMRARERHRNVRSRRRRRREAGRPGCEERALSRNRTAQPRWPQGRVGKTPSAWRRRRR